MVGKLVKAAAAYSQSRRRCLRFVLALAGANALTASAVGLAAQTPHSAITSLNRPAREAWRDRQPIVLMFSLPGCAWCDAVRREHLNGLAEQQSSLGVRFIELTMNERRAFSDRDPPGQPAPSGDALWWQANSPAECARMLKVRMAPTVLFMGPEGEVAERLIGYGSPDFYGAYLEQRIAQARSRLISVDRP